MWSEFHELRENPDRSPVPKASDLTHPRGDRLLSGENIHAHQHHVHRRLQLSRRIIDLSDLSGCVESPCEVLRVRFWGAYLSVLVA